MMLRPVDSELDFLVFLSLKSISSISISSSSSSSLLRNLIVFSFSRVLIIDLGINLLMSQSSSLSCGKSKLKVNQVVYIEF